MRLTAAAHNSIIKQKARKIRAGFGGKQKMKVLAIGNSFSNDAMRYLHNIAKAEGCDMKTVNIYIGGCPLSKHYMNMNNDAADYDFEYNGDRTGIKVSIRQALQSDIWDVVTFQQVSSQSVDYETYTPYLGALAEYAAYHAPKAKFMIHQTWAYEQGSERLTHEMGYGDQSEMFSDLKAAYEKAAEELGGVQIIPSGEAFQELIKAGAPRIHRDTFHASLGLGRYTLGLVWYETLTGKSCLNNSFADFDVPVSPEEAELAKRCAHIAAGRYAK